MKKISFCINLLMYSLYLLNKEGAVFIVRVTFGRTINTAFPYLLSRFHSFIELWLCAIGDHKEIFLNSLADNWDCSASELFNLSLQPIRER